MMIEIYSEDEDDDSCCDTPGTLPEDQLWSLATMSVSLNIWNSSPSTSILFPPNSGSSTLSPTATHMGTVSPASVLAPGPTAITRPSLVLAWAFSGINRPPLVFTSAAAL